MAATQLLSSNKFENRVIETWCDDLASEEFSKEFFAHNQNEHNASWQLADQQKSTVFSLGDKDYSNINDKIRYLVSPQIISTLQHFISSQKWEGVVESINGNSFLAKLHDMKNPGHIDEAEIDFEAVSDDDRELIQPGAVFYWNVGYNTTLDGQRTFQFIIKFRRLPVWAKDELKNAMEQAIELERLFNDSSPEKYTATS